MNKRILAIIISALLLIAAIPIVLMTLAGDDTDPSISLTKTVSWAETYTRANITLESKATGPKSTTAPRVLFLGTLCSAHGLDQQKIVSSINAVSKNCEADVDYFLYPGDDKPTNPSYSGTVKAGETLPKNTEKNITMTSGNHKALHKFLDTIYSQIVTNKVSYDYIVLEFDRTIIAHSYGVEYSGKTMPKSSYEAEVAEIMKGFYDNNSVLWILKPNDVEEKSGDTPEETPYNVTPMFYRYNDTTSKMSWQQLDYDDEQKNFYAERRQYNAYKALVAPDYYNAGDVKDDARDTVTGIANQIDYNATADELATYVSATLTKHFAYSVSFNDKIHIDEGCVYDDEHTHFEISSDGKTWQTIPRDTTDYKCSISYDSKTATVSGKFEELKGVKYIRLVISVFVTNPDDNLDFKKLSKTGNPNDGAGSVTMEIEGMDPITDTATPSNTLNWPVNITYKVDSECSAEHCTVSLAKETAKGGGQLMTDTPANEVLGSTADGTGAWKFVSWTDDATGKIVSTDPYYKPAQVEGRNVDGSYTAHFKYDPPPITALSAEQRSPWNGYTDITYTLAKIDPEKKYKVIAEVELEGGDTETFTLFEDKNCANGTFTGLIDLDEEFTTPIESGVANITLKLYEDGETETFISSSEVLEDIAVDTMDPRTVDCSDGPKTVDILYDADWEDGDLPKTAELTCEYKPHTSFEGEEVIDEVLSGRDIYKWTPDKNGIYEFELQFGDGTTYNTTYIVTGFPHTHAFTYSADKNVITANCLGDGDCDYKTTPPTLTLTEPESTVYTGSPITVDYKTGEATYFKTATGIDAPEITYTALDGGSLTDGKPIEAGKYKATATVDGDKTAELIFTVEKATPVITVPPTASDITYGDSVDDSTLSDGTANVDGTFTWEESEKVKTPSVCESGNEYTVVFTPDDTHNYNTTTCKVPIVVNKAPQTAPEENEGYTVDEDRYITVEEGYEVSEVSDDFSEIIPSGTQLKSETEYYVRKVEDDNHLPSPETEFLIPHVHNIVEVAGLDPTEDAPGYRTYFVCKDDDDACGECFENADGTMPIENLDEWKSEGGRGYLNKLDKNISPKTGYDTKVFILLVFAMISSLSVFVLTAIKKLKTKH
ncbi:MAG: hypothetical protein MJ091_04660 [Clostridia bacterium]|nr:hypothetical protein [Clostridia bacterium]